MKKIIKLFLILTVILCGCSKKTFKNKTYIYKDKSIIEYKFISNNTVQYKTKNTNYTCKYNIETTNMIKIICNNDVELLLYDNDNDCIYDHNSRVYCIK